MSSINWFEGDSVMAMAKMQKNNSAFFVAIAKKSPDHLDILFDPDIVQLLNNEVIVCFYMTPHSQCFENFKKIFNNISIPSIYILEKNNSEQFNILIKKSNILSEQEVKLDFLDLKIQILNSLYSTIKHIYDSLNGNVEEKQKYLKFMTEVTDKLQDSIINRQKVIEGVQNLKKYTKIRIKVPCKDITFVQEFPITNTLFEVTTFILNNVSVPEGSIKFIAHRQFMEEDFNQTLDALNLCPSSTIYVHKVPSDQSQPILYNFQSWLWRIINFVIWNPFNYAKNIFSPTVMEQKSGQLKETKFKRRSYFKSNIHTLRSDDSDDENNTYNGNSTQQQ